MSVCAAPARAWMIDSGGHYVGGGVAYVIQGNTWAGGAGGPATISYSFAGANYATTEGGGGNIVPLNLGNTGISAVNWQTQIVLALNAWVGIVDGALGAGTLVFNLVADSNTAFNAGGATGDIRFGGEAMDGAGGVLAHAYYPPPNGVSAAGDTHFDVGDVWKIGFGGGDFDIFQVAAHEIGHALGLAHTAVPNSLMNPFYTEAFAGPQADDIAGIINIFDGAGFGGGASVPEPVTSALSLIGLAFLLRRFRRISGRQSLGQAVPA